VHDIGIEPLAALEDVFLFVAEIIFIDFAQADIEVFRASVP